MHVLLLESRKDRRDLLAGALRHAGITVTAADRIAEIERWPRGDIVVTRPQWLAPFWAPVGALHGIVLADEGDAAPSPSGSDGASGSLPADCSPDDLICTLRSLAEPQPA